MLLSETIIMMPIRLYGRNLNLLKLFRRKTTNPWCLVEYFGVRSSNGTSMSAHHDLQQVFVHFDNSVGNTLATLEEDDGEECYLKLRADSNERAAQWLHQAFPAKLQANDVIVHIWL